MTAAITGTGIWAPPLRYGEAAEITSTAAELESLGYTALWVPDVGGDLFEALDRLLDATEQLVVGSGVLNVWKQAAADTIAWWTRLSDEHKQRVMLGIGVSHAPFIGADWQQPLAVTSAYLDALDAGGPPVDSRCVAALGPKMLDLAARRSAGSLTYLVMPEHTAIAREALGAGQLYVEQGVVLCTDAEVARDVARSALVHYFNLPNYTNNWKRLGFTDEDVTTKSDPLIDALVVWGDDDAIKARVEAHRQAGADHVCLQVLDAPEAAGMDVWRALAP
jgi:probable F420-dependent oxidoreductase